MEHIDKLDETAEETVKGTINMLRGIDAEVAGANRADLHAALCHLLRIWDRNYGLKSTVKNMT